MKIERDFINLEEKQIIERNNLDLFSNNRQLELATFEILEKINSVINNYELITKNKKKIILEEIDDLIQIRDNQYIKSKSKIRRFFRRH